MPCKAWIALLLLAQHWPAEPERHLLPRVTALRAQSIFGSEPTLVGRDGRFAVLAVKIEHLFFN